MLHIAQTLACVVLFYGSLFGGLYLALRALQD
jgi:hypothetical protein